MRTYQVASSIDNLVLGSAHTYWIGDSMVDADIRLHPSRVDEVNVEEVMIHEFGHGIGISHSSYALSMMHWIILKSQPTLHADDLLAACELYGKCSPMMDDEGTLGISKIEHEDKCFYGYLPSRGVWPDDVQVSESEC